MFSKLLLNAVFLFSVLTSFAQTDTGKKVNTKLIKVNNKIYMLQGQGGNIGLSFGNDGVFMIDDQFAEGIEEIQEEIKKISDKPIRLLVNTHFHEDHTGGNTALAKTGTVIFSHDNVRTRLQGLIRGEAKKIMKEVLPIVTFSEELNFHFNGEKINVFHVQNAHTDGDAMIYFTGSNVLHTGDVFFNGKYPFIDLENGGSLKGVVEGLQKAMLLINEDTKIIPGHGDIGTYSDLQNTVKMLGSVYKRVATSFVNNKTEDEVAKMNSLTEEFDAQGYGKGFINTEAFLRMIYKSVAQDRNSIESNDEKNEKALEKIEQMKKEYKKKNKN